MMTTRSKGLKEYVARFCENPSREGARDLLRNHSGESDNCDFKKEWPDFSKVARHILGMANSGGGCLIFGLEEKEDGTFDCVGIDKLIDKADIQKGIQKFIPVQLKYESLDFSFEDSEYPKIIGKKFQFVLVEDTPAYIPFVANDGKDIRKNAIYIRRGTATEEANYEELQEIFNRRLETGYSSQREFNLEKHLGELECLYRHIPRFDFDTLPSLASMMDPFNVFVKQEIKEKKEIIQAIILRK